MGQPITVVEKPSSNPAIVRFETNRPLSGTGHESYTTAPGPLLHRPVDELARRLFAAGGVERVHINGSVVTVSLGGGRTGAGLGDVVRNLFLHYPGQPSQGVSPPVADDDKAPMSTADPGDTPAARAAAEPAAAEPAAADVGAAAHAVAVEDGGGAAPEVAEPEQAPVEGVPDDELRAGHEGAAPENEPTEGPLAEEPASPTSDAVRTAADQASDPTDPEG